MNRWVEQINTFQPNIDSVIHSQTTLFKVKKQLIIKLIKTFFVVFFFINFFIFLIEFLVYQANRLFLV